MLIHDPCSCTKSYLNKSDVHANSSGNLRQYRICDSMQSPDLGAWCEEGCFHGAGFQQAKPLQCPRSSACHFLTRYLGLLKTLVYEWCHALKGCAPKFISSLLLLFVPLRRTPYLETLPFKPLFSNPSKWAQRKEPRDKYPNTGQK